MRGIVTVLNTPYTEVNSIDFDGLRKNVAKALDAGIAGFLVPAMASEVDQLSQQEKHDIVAQVVDQVAGQVPVIGGASASVQRERLDLAAELIDLGCAGILVSVDAATDPNQIESDLIQIADLEPRFLMIQDWDSSGQGLSIETIERLFQRIERFKWLKIEVQHAGPKYTQVLNATGGKLGVAGGWAVTQMMDGLDRGVHVFMPTAMHDIYVEIYRRYMLHDRDGAKQLFEKIEPVLAFSNQRLDVSIRFFKRMLYAQGIYATPNVRIDGVPLNSDQQRIADDLIRLRE